MPIPRATHGCCPHPPTGIDATLSHAPRRAVRTVRAICPKDEREAFLDRSMVVSDGAVTPGPVTGCGPQGSGGPQAPWPPGSVAVGLGGSGHPGQPLGAALACSPRVLCQHPGCWARTGGPAPGLEDSGCLTPVEVMLLGLILQRLPLPQSRACGRGRGPSFPGKGLCSGTRRARGSVTRWPGVHQCEIPAVAAGAEGTERER